MAMEFQFPSITILLISFLFLLMLLVKTKKTYKSKNPAPKLPPGPPKLPVIGNMHQLGGSQVHHQLRDLAENYGAIMHLQLGELSTVVVSSPETAAEILKTHDIIFASRPYRLASEILSYNTTNIAFAPYGDYWRQLRKICIVELLSPKRVQTFRAIREEEVLNMIKSVASDARTPTDLSKRIFSLTFGITARAAFGKKSKQQEEFVSIVDEAGALAAGFSIVDMYPSVKCLEYLTGRRRIFERMFERIDYILQTIVNEHRAREKSVGEAEDLVDVLLRVQKDGDLEFPLADNNIKAVIFDIFSAGSETSSTTVEWTLSEMLKHPDVLKRAQAEVRDVFKDKGNVDESGLHELKYLKLVIKETLRLHPAAPLLLPRECSKDVVINGYDIPATTKVIVNAWAIGRDPRYWNEPEKFKPERFLDTSYEYKGTSFEYIPFGAGRRICPGISFSIPNVELPLAQLLYHFDWELPGGLSPEDLDMTETFGITVRRVNGLRLVPIPYQYSNLK